ncbi:MULTISPECIES: hypothetical protein [unclassified Caballeronia]|uniref:hypothetical protein n=1 Tax=unclassified Caballeronia TaxID=2646786 RepID=UPI0020285F85|nr:MULTISPECIES: hypothetical protein [unclassified Caballeronia]
MAKQIDGDDMDLNSSPEHGISITHVYGVLSLVPSVIGIIVALKQSTDTSQWLLLASGWIAAVFLAAFLIHMSKQFSREISVARAGARKDGLTIGQLQEKVEDLYAEINRRHATLDYLSGLLIGTRGTPRQSTTAPIDSAARPQENEE